jgi:PAS domain S-box-containing protein
MEAVGNRFLVLSLRLLLASSPFTTSINGSASHALDDVDWHPRLEEWLAHTCNQGGLLMISNDLSQLTHSWPLFERDRQFAMGQDFAWSSATMLDLSAGQAMLAQQGIGTWECNLSNNVLTWSPEVYGFFGMSRNKPAGRKLSVSLYREDSRVKMERLRAYSIKHQRGFTLDAEIVPANGGRRWIRVIAAPVCIGNRAVQLQGFKRDVTHEYR